MKLAVPGLLMIALEWSVIEILFFLAGVLGETALSVSIVWYQTLIVFYMVSRNSWINSAYTAFHLKIRQFS